MFQMLSLTDWLIGQPTDMCGPWVPLLKTVVSNEAEASKDVVVSFNRNKFELKPLWNISKERVTEYLRILFIKRNQLDITRTLMVDKMSKCTIFCKHVKMHHFPDKNAILWTWEVSLQESKPRKVSCIGNQETQNLRLNWWLGSQTTSTNYFEWRLAVCLRETCSWWLQYHVTS